MKLHFLLVLAFACLLCNSLIAGDNIFYTIKTNSADTNSNITVQTNENTIASQHDKAFYKLVSESDTALYLKKMTLRNGKLVYSKDITIVSKLDNVSSKSLKNAFSSLKLKDKISFSLGTIMMPIKMRFSSEDSNHISKKDFSFSGSFNVGATAGMRVSLNKENSLSASILFGLSVSHVEIDERESQGHYTDKTPVAAMSPSMNFIVSYKKFNAGFAVGWDILNQTIGKYWIYNKKTWLGIGIGVQITDTENSQAESRIKKQMQAEQESNASSK